MVDGNRIVTLPTMWKMSVAGNIVKLMIGCFEDGGAMFLAPLTLFASCFRFPITRRLTD